MISRIRSQVLPLAVIVIVAIAARLLYLYWEMHAPGFQWSDPDGYFVRQAAALTRSGAWRWTIRAVQYTWGGKIWLLPPGYPVFLSFFFDGGTPDFAAAAVAQAILAGLAAIPLFVLGRALHSPRAGIVAALIWAVWFPSVTGRETFVQEQIYLPLLWTAFAAMAWCLSASAPPMRFAAAGLALGVASLVRAMPLFYLVCLLPLLWFCAPKPGRGRGALAFAAGFALVVVPYIAWLSVHAGRLVLIDNHIMIMQTGVEQRTSVGSIVSMVASGFVTELGDKLKMARGLFQVYGSSWLYHYGGAVSAAGARWMGLFVHLTLDSLFVVVALLAAPGLAFARQRRVALLLLSWILFVIAASAGAGFTGPRYRAPLEGMLICAAAVLVGGGLRRPSRAAAAAASVATLALAVVVIPPYFESWRAPVPYGLNGWTRGEGFEQTFGRGPVGFYAPSVNGSTDIEVQAADGAQPLNLSVKVDGVKVTAAHLEGGEATRLRVPIPNLVITFVELEPDTAPADRAPTFYIRTPR